MYLRHRYGFSSISLQICSSNSAINNILYGGANFVPIAEHRFFFKAFSLKVKTLFLRTTPTSFTSVEVVTSFSCFKSSHSRRADRPYSCEMLGYKPITSTGHKIIPSGRLGSKERSFLKKIISIFYVGFYFLDQRLQMKV